MSSYKLVKISGKRINIWEAVVSENVSTYKWGVCNGKMQEKINKYEKGKNIGKKNETTPSQQAISETESTMKKKIDDGYIIVPSSISDENALRTYFSKNVDEIDVFNSLKTSISSTFFEK